MSQMQMSQNNTINNQQLGSSSLQNSNNLTNTNFNLYKTQDVAGLYDPSHGYNSSSYKTRKKCKCTGSRDEKVPKDLYYDVVEENEMLKRTILSNNEKIKKLAAESSNIKRNIIKERNMADRKGQKVDEKDYTQVENENYKLKEKLSKMKIYIKGLESGKPDRIKKKTSSILGSAKNDLKKQKINNDNKALVAALREQLKILNEDRRALLMELQNRNTKTLKGAKTGSAFPAPGMEDAIDYKSQISDLQTNAYKSAAQLHSQNSILELTKKRLEEYIEMLEKEKEKNRKLEVRISIYETEAEKIKEYQTLIDDYKNREKVLEQRISDLCDSPFIKQAEERGNIFRKYQETQKTLTELEDKDRENNFKLRSLEKDNKKLKEDLDLSIAERDKYKEEAMRLKAANLEKEKINKQFEDQINLIGQYGEVDSNFKSLLSLMKTHSPAGDWANIDFLNPAGKDAAFLAKEVERLKIDKGILGEELENTKSLLLTMTSMKEEIERERELEGRKHNVEVKMLKDKISELAKLVDIERLPKEYIVKDPNTGALVLKDKIEYMKELIPKGISSEAGILDDKITEFSDNSSEADFSPNENALDVYIGECLYEDGAGEELGFPIEGISSFITIDFFIHETQTSDVLPGTKPVFNLQMSFRVNVDEQVLTYFENDNITIELYYIRDNIQTLFGKGKIGLKDLLECETEKNQNGSRVINSICSIYLNDKPNLKIASLHYKMRMRNPISEALKWYHINQKEIIYENNKNKELQDKNAINELSPEPSPISVKILITSANNLTISGPPRQIKPFIYYKFFENFEKFSQVLEGQNPEFSDISSYNIVKSMKFYNYVETDTLNVFVFDAANPVEAEIEKEGVKLVNTNQQVQQDLIGIAYIPLKSLNVSGIVKGNFDILNEKGQKAGELVASVYIQNIEEIKKK